MALKKLPGHEVDLDATDELPALDYPLPGESHASTDVFPTPVIPAGMVELADSLRDVEQRLQRKIERLDQLEAELRQAAEQARELRERLQQQESTAAARETALGGELGEREAQLAQLREEHSGGQRELAELRGQLQSQLAVLADAQGRLSQRNSEHSHAARDAEEWRRRAERNHEVLTGWQSFRSMSEAMIGDSERALAEVETQLNAARTDAARRISELEEAVRSASQSQQAQAEALRVAREEATAAGAQLGARETSIAGLQQQLADAQGSASQRIADLEESLRESGRAQDEQMEALQALTLQTVELRSGLEARETEALQLQQHLKELRINEEQARKGAAVHEAQLHQIGSLQTDLTAAEARILELEQQLRHSAERVQRLESEAHASAALLGNLQLNMERLGRDDTGSRPVLKEAMPDVVRTLVRQESGADVVYRLGRRTTIGRTTENDIQVDTTFVSRHHAVLLSSNDHCIVEDLNSTNGVLVNGRRVGRHILQDGDMVTVGKTEFRYQQRS